MIRDLQVNQEECTGCGDCAKTCPSRFQLTYKVVAEVRGQDSARLQDKVLAAYNGCPVQAIEFSSEDSSLFVAWHPARIIGKRQLSDASMLEVRLAVDLYDFIPGQYITLRMKDDVGYFNRAYSIVELYEGVLTLCVTLVDGGRGSSFFNSQSEGVELEVTDPRGAFGVKKTNTPKVFVATGAGLAPLLPMMESSPEAQKTLYFGQRNERELFYLDRLEKIPNLKVIPCLDDADDDWAGFHGRVTECIRDNPLPRGTEVYTCGSDAMMYDLEKVLRKKRHPKRLFFRESFSGAHSSLGEAGLKVLPWLRNIHVYVSLLFSMLFLFFAFSGFLASRPELFSADDPQTLPANIALEQGELGGFYKAQFGENFFLTGYRQEGDYSVVELRSPLDRIMEVEISHTDRSYTVTEYHPIPPALTEKDNEALVMQLSKQLNGKLDLDSISQDEEQVQFRLDSVWLRSFITIDRANKQYVIMKEPIPLARTMILLHKGKLAEPYQKAVMDLTAWAMIIATATGMIMIFLPKSSRLRLVAGVLVSLSIILFFAMMIHR